MSVPNQIEFNRPTKFKYVSTLGSGACGVTIQVRDEGMACDFVVKKYKPIVSPDENPKLFSELLERFRDEARILFHLYHRNVVRVFNFFDYREHLTSYIVMEYVSGTNVIEFLRHNPAAAHEVFEGVVAGFMHLQEKGVLHRDIRPDNILVESTGSPKIIDFGFGKKIDADLDLLDRKSISLNWWCPIPPEFSEGTYDFQTEVYFVGKMFQLAIEECGLSNFKYRSVINRMSAEDRMDRLKSFSEVQGIIMEGKFQELEFADAEIAAYRAFSTDLIGAVSSIRSDASFVRDSAKILEKLEKLYRENMLEDFIAAPNAAISIFCAGNFRYWRKAEISVKNLNSFIGLLRGVSEEKRSIILENMMARLDAVERTEPEVFDDEIPF